MRLRVGMIGTGSMAKGMAGDFALAGLDLVAVAGRNRERTRRFADEYGVAAALSVDELLQRDLDLVYIATTHDSHLELAEAAMRAGHAVLVEKAFTVNAGEAEQLVATARSTGRFLMEAMWMRFTPALRTVQQMIADGTIGDPRTIMATFGFSLPFGPHRLRDPAVGGGSLLDQGVYPLALADVILGEPVMLSATRSRADADGAGLDVDTELAVLLGYDRGQQALLATSIRSTLPTSATIAGRDARIELVGPFWGSQRVVVHRGSGDPQQFDIPREGRGYVPMLRAVREALNSGWLEHPLADHASTLRVMRAVDRVAAALA